MQACKATKRASGSKTLAKPRKIRPGLLYAWHLPEEHVFSNPHGQNPRPCSKNLTPLPFLASPKTVNIQPVGPCILIHSQIIYLLKTLNTIANSIFHATKKYKKKKKINHLRVKEFKINTYGSFDNFQVGEKCTGVQKGRSRILWCLN